MRYATVTPIGERDQSTIEREFADRLGIKLEDVAVQRVQDWTILVGARP